MTEEEFMKYGKRLDELMEQGEVCATDWCELIEIAATFRDAIAHHYIEEEYDGFPH